MATPTAERGQINLRSVLPAGLLPDNIDSPDAEAQAQAALAKLASKPSPPAVPKKGKVNAPAPPADPAPEPIPSTNLSSLDPLEVPEPAAPKAPEPDLPVSEFPEADLLKSLESPEPEKKPEAPKTTDALDLEADPEAPIALPKDAAGMQKAIITVSKKARELQKVLKLKEAKIAELEKNGSIDVAVKAQEPLKATIAALEAERTQLRTALAAQDLTQDPGYQQLIRPAILAESFINQMGERNAELDTRALFRASQIADPAAREAAVREATADLHPNAAYKIEEAVNAIQVIRGEAAKWQQNAVAIKAQREKAQQEKMAAAQAERRAKSVHAHDESFKALSGDPVLKQILATNADLQKRFDGLLEQAKAAELDPTYASDPAKLATAIQKSLAYDLRAEASNRALKNALDALKKARTELLQYKGGGIGLNPRTPYQPPASSSKPPQDVRSAVEGAFAAHGVKL